MQLLTSVAHVRHNLTIWEETSIQADPKFRFMGTFNLQLCSRRCHPWKSVLQLRPRNKVFIRNVARLAKSKEDAFPSSNQHFDPLIIELRQRGLFCQCSKLGTPLRS